MSFNNDKKIFDSITTQDIQRRIIVARKESKLSQDEMADKLNIPRSTYAYHEKKATELSIEFIKKVSDVLGVPYDYLCTGILRLSQPEPPPAVADTFFVTSSEKKIIEKYRLLPLDARKEIRDVVDDLYSKHKIKP